MSADPCIMVATEIEGDAALVKKLLSDEFPNVVISTDPARSTADFEAHEPDVLILAFNTLEKAERYYLGLYRLSSRIQSIPHRTLILCNKDDLPRVYELCRQEYFDDYILFWPLTFDSPRLLLAVHHALAHLRHVPPRHPDAREFAESARTIAELEPRLSEHSAQGRERMDAVGKMFVETVGDLGSVVDGLTRRLATDEMRRVVEVHNPAALDREIHEFRVREIDPIAARATAALEPLREWSDNLPEAVGQQLESARKLGQLAQRVKPAVLIVDDDDFQHSLLRRILPADELDLLFVHSVTEAFALMRSLRPDLILMDINLPDINGIEATRRIRSTTSLADTPVMMITGQSTKDMVVESLRAGANDFIAKPIEKKALIEKIQQLLGRAVTSRSAGSQSRSGG